VSGEACEYTGALLVTVKKALPSVTAAGADGGPTTLPPTNVPSGADTANTAGTRESRAA
jgi:hypothetical protein